MSDGADLMEEVARVKQIEEAILSISEAIKKLRGGKLIERAILVLLKAACGKIPEKVIKKVLDELENLAKTYLTEDKKK